MTELHAGIGVIGLSLAAAPGKQLSGLRLVEVNPAAAEPFRASLGVLRRRQVGGRARALVGWGEGRGVWGS